ncbi:MAG: holo-ACP synthase [Solirubrobacteraceae bacterium]
MRIGLDFADVGSVAQAIAEHGERYLRRIYTEQERRDCGDAPRKLAARFAAKEATIKALGGGEGAIPWTAVGVGRSCAATEDPVLSLSGAASELARARRVSSLQLSIKPGRRYAAAIVVAVTELACTEISKIGEVDDSVRCKLPR